MDSFVNNVRDSELTVVCTDDSAKEKVKSLGGKRTFLHAKMWKIPYSSEDHLAEVLSSLRDSNFAMAGAASGWPPSQVFQKLREDKKISGEFVEVMWSGPGEKNLVER